MPLVEVVCCSPEDCRQAEQAGAGRIELCGAILAGGLTPSYGLYEACRAATSLPIMVMIRPREGGFLYSNEEFAQMETDLALFRDRGAYGFVTGILLEDGQIDLARMALLRDLAGPSMQAMCHRAFDVTPDPLAALEALIAACYDRVLSSGQQRDLALGMDLLAALGECADGRIEVQPCEHIRAHNAPEVVTRLKPRSIHLGPFLDAMDPTSDLGRPVTYGGHKVLDADQVRAVVASVINFE